LRSTSSFFSKNLLQSPAKKFTSSQSNDLNSSSKLLDSSLELVDGIFEESVELVEDEDESLEDESLEDESLEDESLDDEDEDEDESLDDEDEDEDEPVDDELVLLLSDDAFSIINFFWGFSDIILYIMNIIYIQVILY
jgi:hypothetical protein